MSLSRSVCHTWSQTPEDRFSRDAAHLRFLELNVFYTCNCFQIYGSCNTSEVLTIILAKNGPGRSRFLLSSVEFFVTAFSPATDSFCADK